jgi:two-component system, OmpR family, copper resistance phosphate regulon response regulator CusR
MRSSSGHNFIASISDVVPRGIPVRLGAFGMKVLLIEDDRETSDYIRGGLEASCFTVVASYRGDEVLHLATTGNFDIIILDVMLPGIDGWSALAAMRAAGLQTPVLFLTAHDEVKDRVRGLELGADDYLVKPFAFSELVARIRSVLRRGVIRQAGPLRVSDLEIDTLRLQASRDGHRLDLRPKEFALLTLLARRTGEVLSRTTIAEQVWDMNFDGGSNVVDVHVRRLRAKVDEPFAIKLIHTIRGAGYVLEARG